MKVRIELELDDALAKRYGLADAMSLQSAILQGLRYILAYEFCKDRKLSGRTPAHLHAEYSREANDFVVSMSVLIEEDAT